MGGASSGPTAATTLPAELGRDQAQVLVLFGQGAGQQHQVGLFHGLEHIQV